MLFSTDEFHCLYFQLDKKSNNRQIVIQVRNLSTAKSEIKSVNCNFNVCFALLFS